MRDLVKPRRFDIKKSKRSCRCRIFEGGSCRSEALCPEMRSGSGQPGEPSWEQVGAEGGGAAWFRFTM